LPALEKLAGLSAKRREYSEIVKQFCSRAYDMPIVKTRETTLITTSLCREKTTPAEEKDTQQISQAMSQELEASPCPVNLAITANNSVGSTGFVK
jgi:hypothetical protein